MYMYEVSFKMYIQEIFIMLLTFYYYRFQILADELLPGTTAAATEED